MPSSTARAAGQRCVHHFPDSRLSTDHEQTAALLFSEYICLAIMSFPWSYSILGLVPGLILTVVIAGLVLYTSLITW
jgi:hypothetical protein